MWLFFNKQKKENVNKMFMYGGIKFRSKMEMERYIFLEQMQDEGHLSNLKVYPEIELVPHVVEEAEVNGKKKKKVVQRAILFQPDFTYTTDRGEQVVEEVLTDKKKRNNKYYALKKKLLFAIHKIKVHEVLNKAEWINYGVKPR